ncbi:protease complex subunit PrcB family protein [Colwellia sp. MSW7]|uniref:Protease complex subunit PrcB family protein n=1 Tax=Colwellia maritima TaxID=2912588 RepID=A0ABS9X700_9GAMM|nr:protease complex subunit PrcB family protein [Colwellia maritima]MCI2286015.1 protease complex subunit PrcB family protein [Colwellia maritima]
MKRLLILVPFIFQIQGCNDANATSPVPASEYEILHEAHYNEYANSTNKSFLVIKSQTDYEYELLKRTSEAIKTVNFEEETIVLIDMGIRNSGGHTIDIQSFTEENDYIRAKVILTLPGGNCSTTQAITNPFKLIKLKTTKDVLVTEELRVKSC